LEEDDFNSSLIKSAIRGCSKASNQSFSSSFSNIISLNFFLSSSPVERRISVPYLFSISKRPYSPF